MHGSRQRLDNMVASVEAAAVLHNIHTMMRIEEGDEEEQDQGARPRGEGDETDDEDDQVSRRRRRMNDIDAGNSSSEDEEDIGAQPVRQSKEAVRAEGQALRDSILSAYFSANF